jgi:hypothetical protein
MIARCSGVGAEQKVRRASAKGEPNLNLNSKGRSPRHDRPSVRHGQPHVANRAQTLENGGGSVVYERGINRVQGVGDHGNHGADIAGRSVQNILLIAGG